MATGFDGKQLSQKSMCGAGNLAEDFKGPWGPAKPARSRGGMIITGEGRKEGPETRGVG